MTGDLQLRKIPDAAGALTPYRPTAKKTVICLLRSDIEAHILASATRRARAPVERQRRASTAPLALDILARFGYHRPGTEPAPDGQRR